MNRARLQIALLFILLLAGFSRVRAQEDYVIGPGDRIRIDVIGENGLATEGVITPAGTITFWILGDLQAAGKTVAEFKSELTKTLAEKYFQKPVVKAEILQYHSKEVVVQGAVKTPGSYFLDTNSTTILKIISSAGSVSENVGTYAYIIRGYIGSGKSGKDIAESIANDPNRVEVNLKKLLLDGDLREDQPVYGGDFVFVASVLSEELSRNYVWVEGSVKNPGRIPYQPGLTVLSAVIAAGDFSEYASQNKGVVTRKNPDGTTSRIKVKIKDIRKGKKPDVPLQPGDRLTIPESFF